MISYMYSIIMLSSFICISLLYFVATTGARTFR